jgi:hypothetical protein
LQLHERFIEFEGRLSPAGFKRFKQCFVGRSLRRRRHDLTIIALGQAIQRAPVDFRGQ